MTPSPWNSQKRLEHKENQTKYRNMTRKPRSHVTTLMYRTWAINFYLLSRYFRLFLLKETRGEFWEGGATVPHIACIASVCVWFQSKGKLRNNEEWDFWFWPQEKWNKSQKYNLKEGGGGGEGPYPSPLTYSPHFTCVLWLSFLVLGSKTNCKSVCDNSSTVWWWGMKIFMSKINNHGRSNEPMNPPRTRIHWQFIWSIRVQRKSFLQLATQASWS